VREEEVRVGGELRLVFYRAEREGEGRNEVVRGPPAVRPSKLMELGGAAVAGEEAVVGCMLH
jgi:hypothetical protein